MSILASESMVYGPVEAGGPGGEAEWMAASGAAGAAEEVAGAPVGATGGVAPVRSAQRVETMV